MKVIIPGHRYEVENFEQKEYGQIIQFIHKKPKEEGSAELITLSDGTTTEELIETVIDRMKYLQEQFPCKENACCITHLQEGLHWLHERTRDREKRKVEGKQLA